MDNTQTDHRTQNYHKRAGVYTSHGDRTMPTIAEQNDQFRKAVFFKPQRNGRLMLTRGVADLPDETLKAIALAVINQTEFDADTDPHGEHDLGSVEYAGVKAFWKIDYYVSPACEYGAENPADPSTYRVMTVMLAEDY